MLEYLFDDAGTKIKNYAKGLFVIEAISAVIGGIVLAIEIESFFVAIAVILGGIAVAYISSLFLCAFGDLVESSANIVIINDLILKKLNGTPSATVASPIVMQTPAQSNTSATSTARPIDYNSYAAANGQGSTSKPVVMAKPDMWICKHCGTENSKNYAICKKCGKYKNS